MMRILPHGGSRAGELTLAAGASVFAISLADDAALRGADWAVFVFWLALALLVGLFAFRLLGEQASRRERLYLVVVLGLALYLVKFLRSPDSFTFTDEFMQLRTATDIIRSGQLFGFNPLLPISTRYPGMQLATTAVLDLTGMNLFGAGALVIGASHMLAIVCLYLVFERATHSSRVAALAALLYTANPHYLYWDSQFSYESFALPLELAALLFAVEYARSREPGRSGSRTRWHVGWPWLAATLLALLAAVPSHHVSVYIFLGVFALWALVSLGLSLWGRRPRLVGNWIPLAVGVVAALLWVREIAPQTPHYLGAQVGNAVLSAFRVLTGGLKARHIFVSGGLSAPLWQRLIGVASAGLLVLSIPFGLIVVWLRYRRSALLITFGLIALVYPFTLLLHLSPQGVETGDRAVEFVFLGLAPIGALAAIWLVRRGRWRLGRQAVVAAACSGVFIGGAVLGWSFYLQLPSPPGATAVPSVTDPQAQAAARWMLSHLGPHKVIATDGTDALLIGSLGDQNPVTSAAGPVPPWPIFVYSKLGAVGDRLLKQGRIEYIEVNQRLARGLPQGSNFFGQGAPTQKHRFSEAVLSKFTRMHFLSRIYDSGDIQIYEVTGAIP